MKNIFDLRNSVCVVTGAGGALGGEVAQHLGEAGAKVAVLDIREELAHQTAAAVTDAGGQALALQCDVLDREQLQEARRAVIKTFGIPDSLINAAGGNDPAGTTDCDYYSEDAERTFLDLDMEGMKRTFDLNYFGTVLPTQVFTADMVKNRHGSVVNFGSVSSINPLTRVVSYSSAKSAVVNFTKWLAVHYAGHNVRVNAIAPGFVMTEQLRFLHVKPDGSYTPRAESVLHHTPMGRYAESRELVGAITWLLSEASSFVTGSLVTIDGGFSSYTI